VRAVTSVYMSDQIPGPDSFCAMERATVLRFSRRSRLGRWRSGVSQISRRASKDGRDSMTSRVAAGLSSFSEVGGLMDEGISGGVGLEFLVGAILCIMCRWVYSSNGYAREGKGYWQKIGNPPQEAECWLIMAKNDFSRDYLNWMLNGCSRFIGWWGVNKEGAVSLEMRQIFERGYSKPYLASSALQLCA